jgi:hypothetical protein
MERQRVSLSDKEVEEKIEEFRDWIENEPKLPKNLGKGKEMK